MSYQNNSDFFASIQAQHRAQLINPANQYYFPSDLGKGLLLGSEEAYIANIVQGRKSIDAIPDALFRLSQFHLLYSQYALYNKGEYSLALNAFSQASKYAAVGTSSVCTYNKYLETQSFLNQPTVARIIAMLLIAGEEQSLKTILGFIFMALYDPNTRLLLVDKQLIHPVLWFVISLCEYWHKNNSFLDNLKVGGIQYPYDKALKLLQTEDKTQVNMLVDLLCENHLELARDNDVYSGFTEQLFPYEILTWLAVRRHKGVSNPDAFDHPLMNTPFVKMFHHMAKPYEIPSQPPYIQPLLQKLKYYSSLSR